MPWDTTLTDPHYRVKVKRSFMRTGPGEKQKSLQELQSGTYLKVLAHSGDWYRIRLPNGKQGFVQNNHVENLEKGKRHRLKKEQPLLSDIYVDSAPMSFLKPQSAVSVLAFFHDFAYVETKEGLRGWLLLPKKSS